MRKKGFYFVVEETTPLEENQGANTKGKLNLCIEEVAPKFYAADCVAQHLGVSQKSLQLLCW